MKQTPPARTGYAAALKAAADPNAKPRNRVLVILDVVVSIVLIIFAGGFGTVIVGNATLIASSLHSECTPALTVGMVCNGAVLNGITIGLIVIAVLGVLLSIGMVLVSLIRRRVAFWWPLGAVVILVAAFYLGVWVLGMTVPAVAVP